MNLKLIKNTENINKEKITLFCLPFAGGGASAYNQWAKKMQGKVTVCPVQLPGREERIMEKPYIDMPVMLDDLEEAVREAVDGPYALWGHSMGGKISYELEKRLEAEGYRAKYLFISGSRIPSIPEPKPIYHLPDEAFKRELGRFEGTPKEILENQELLDFFLPMLRADFTMDETYYDKAGVVLHVVCVVIKSTVVNGEGSTIVHSLLEKGINVIQEHPIDIDDYIMCIKIAQKNCCMYRLNTFYPQLSNVKQFIFLAGKLREKNDVQYINAECSVHVLFPLIDILGRAIGGLRPWKFERVEETYKNSPFCIIYGSIYNIPICINVQNQMDPSDPENSVLLFHKISLYTECGNLTMIGTNSDIMWEPRIRKYIAADGGFHLEADDEYLDLPVYEEMHNDEGKCFREMFSDTWPDSIKLFLEDFYRDFYLGKKMDSNAQFLISVCQAWKDLGNSIGSANIIHAYTTKPIKISEIVK